MVITLLKNILYCDKLTKKTIMKKIIEKYLDWSSSSIKFIKVFQILFYYVPAVLIPIGGVFCILKINNFSVDIEGIFISLFIIAASFAAFKILWIRASSLIDELSGNSYFIIPALSHNFRTSGEVVAAFMFLSPIVFIGSQLNVIISQITYMDNISLLRSFSLVPIIGVVIGPICGYVILFLSKGISESFTAVIDIANNTSK